MSFGTSVSLLTLALEVVLKTAKSMETVVVVLEKGSLNDVGGRLVLQ